MTPVRKAALAAGVCYLATFVFSIPALGFYDGVLNDPGFVNGAGYTVAAFSAKIFAALVVVEQGHKVYTNGWYFISACVVLGIVAAYFIRTGPRGQRERLRAANAVEASAS